MLKVVFLYYCKYIIKINYVIITLNIPNYQWSILFNRICLDNYNSKSGIPPFDWVVEVIVVGAVVVVAVVGSSGNPVVVVVWPGVGCVVGPVVGDDDGPVVAMTAASTNWEKNSNMCVLLGRRISSAHDSKINFILIFEIHHLVHFLFQTQNRFFQTIFLPALIYTPGLSTLKRFLFFLLYSKPYRVTSRP